MYAVYGTNHPRAPKDDTFLSGLFLNRKDADEYLESIPEDRRCHHWIIVLHQKSYPVYFIEEFKGRKSEGQKPIDRYELAKKMIMMPKVDDPDHEYFNYYRFEKDYRGIRPGEDCLGATDHHHVDNDHLIWAIDALLERGEKKIKANVDEENNSLST